VLKMPTRSMEPSASHPGRNRDYAGVRKRGRQCWASLGKLRPSTGATANEQLEQ